MRPPLKAHRTAASLLKGGLFPTYPVHQRRPELQATHRLPRPGAAAIVTIGLALAFHLWIEAPLLRWMRGLLRDRTPFEQQVSAETAIDVVRSPH